MPGKKPNPGGRKRDPGVRRQVQAVVRLENDGVWAVAVDEHTGEPKTGKVVRVLEGLSRRKSEEAVAFFLENPSVPLEVVGIVVTPGQPGRPASALALFSPAFL